MGSDISSLKGKLGAEKEVEETILRILEESYDSIKEVAESKAESIMAILMAHEFDDGSKELELLAQKIKAEAEELIDVAKFNTKDEKFREGKHILIPFREEFKDDMLAEIKTATTRTKKYGDPGDFFEVFGGTFALRAVEQMPLKEVRDKHFKEEGCKSPEEFEAKWVSIHPRKEFDPEQIVFFHSFKLIKGPAASKTKTKDETPPEKAKKGPPATTLLKKALPQATLEDWSKMRDEIANNTQMLPLASIRPNKFNPNEMDEETHESTRRGMIRWGPKGTPPITVRPIKDPKEPDIEYEIIDGEQRYTIAGELGWTNIACRIMTLSEIEAKIMCHNASRNRGSINKLKEAKLFLGLKNQKMTLKQMADNFNVSESYISRSIGLLQLPEEKIQKAMDAGISVSSLESITTLKTPESQKLVLDYITDPKTIKDSGVPGVKDVAELVDHVKAQEEGLLKAAELAGGKKFQTCPECEERATNVSTHFETKKEYLICDKGHRWLPETGKDPLAIEMEEPEEEEQTLTKTIRYGIDVENIRDAIKGFVRQLPDFYYVSWDKKNQNKLTIGADPITINMASGDKRIMVQISKFDYESGEQTKIEVTNATCKEDIQYAKDFIDALVTGSVAPDGTIKKKAKVKAKKKGGK